MTYIIENIRSDFPILNKKINENNLIYLDNAASTQKPNLVINCEKNFYLNEYSSVHRGTHTLSNNATNKMEDARFEISKFINAKFSNEIIFTKGTTESINLVAYSWGRNYLNDGDNIIITEMEHHANIVPWQILAKEKNVIINHVSLLANGLLNITNLYNLINNKTKFISITHMSNVIGVLNPLNKIIKYIKSKYNIVILVDGAQSIVHQHIDVQKLNCDFFVFSGHKLYAPTGIGILYGKKSLLNMMPPWECGGSMIKSVNLKSGTIFNDIPWKFEAGSPNILGIIGLQASIKYIQAIGLRNIHNYEKQITEYAIDMLKNIPNIIFYGPKKNRIGIISFNLINHHAYDVGIILDTLGIAIRTGHHCAMPLLNFFNVSSMCRISLAMYTSQYDIDNLIKGLIKIHKLFK
ncbi:MAG: SufS family cysteine desulfurase [Enterobacterales bacterium]